VLVTGFVSDELLLALYQAADLVCFPSLAEGYGLPVAEALACGTPVIAADRSPLDELVGASRRFDPERVDAIATAIEAALDAPPAASDPPATPLNWHDVAQRTGRAFDELLARPGRRPFRSARATRRIAFVSPLPPAPSGIASYSYRLIEELVATGEVAIDAFGDGPTPDQRAPSGVEAFHATSLPCVEEVRGGYDAVVYCLGNSHHHLGALSVLRRRPGIVLAHDVRLTNLYRHEHGDPGFLPGGLGRAIAAMYGQELPSDLGADGSLSPADVARYGLLMAREVLEHSSRWLVTSRAAAELSVLEVGPDLAERVAVLPFAVEAPGATGDPGFASDDAVPAPALAPALAMSWGRLAGEVEPGRPVVGHFGIVDPVKAPELLVEAFARLRRDGAGAPPLLVFVGPVGNEVAYRLAEQVLGLGLEHDVVLTGPLRHDAYRDWLGRASVAVQLRRSTNGEASAAIGECLASGVATVASRLGWVRELPDEAVVKVDSPIEAAELASVLDALLADDQRRAALGRAARDEAARRTFAATARRLLDVVEDERRATS
jgi:glycosyltransferase involved in cell wall biosynthesis